jgi:putative glutamine amidotransferase
MIKIGLTLSVEEKGNRAEYHIPSDYVSAVIDSGAKPGLINPTEDRAALNEYLSAIDGIIITGGDDISPEFYGEENSGMSFNTSRIRDEAEIYIIDKVLELNYPVLGICRGFQLINIYFGGKLYQDLESMFRIGINHRNQFMSPEDLHHEVRIEDGTLLFEIIRSERFMVNSRHHQGVKEIGNGLNLSAYSSDGLAEAVEFPEKNIIAVQWHPENLVSLGGRYKSLFFDLKHRCEKIKNSQ